MRGHLTRRRLSVPAAVQRLEGAGMGGVTVFVGRVRPDRTPRGEVRALDYECDRAAAERRLAEIEEIARRRFDADRVVLWHRLGRVPVGEPSVIAGAACGHRAPSFAAARFLIEELKRSVPIWKRERARSGRRRRPLRGRRGGRSSD